MRLRRPSYERTSEADVDALLIRIPSGASVPLVQVATIERGYAYTEIDRSNGRRVLTVTADVDPLRATSAIVDDMTANVFPEIRSAFPGLRAGFSGRQQDLRDSNQAIRVGVYLCAGRNLCPAHHSISQLHSATYCDVCDSLRGLWRGCRTRHYGLQPEHLFR